MKRQAIDIEKFVMEPFKQWNKDWLLLTAGDFGARKYNCMVVGWGSLGTMWNMPFAQVVVRPSRHTLEFMDKYSTFTLCGFPEAQRQALQLLGSTSGKDGNKIAKSGLTPMASLKADAPSYEEASLVIECRKMYRDRLDPAGFLHAGIAKNYAAKDYHVVFFGEVLSVSAAHAL